MNVFMNAALYQAGWLACTLGAAQGVAWAGPFAATAIIGWHLSRAQRPSDEVMLVVAAAATGLVFETALLATGWIAYPGGAALAGIAPPWMVALWALFATTFNVSLRVLRDRPAIASVLGAVGAPAAYYAGAGLGALTFVAPAPALAAIALGWAIATPMLLRTARRFDGFAA